MAHNVELTHEKGSEENHRYELSPLDRYMETYCRHCKRKSTLEGGCAFMGKCIACAQIFARDWG